MNISEADSFKQQIVLMYPFVYGNPGNANVMSQLYDYNMDGVIQLALLEFRNKYPQYNEENGWLWIIFKTFCQKDINKTIAFLNDLASAPSHHN